MARRGHLKIGERLTQKSALIKGFFSMLFPHENGNQGPGQMRLPIFANMIMNQIIPEAKDF